MLLCSLPKSFDTLIQTQDNNKASFMITCNRLTAEVRRQKLRLTEETPAEMSTAFYSRHDGNAAEEKGSRGGQGNRPRCNHCDRLGHDADRCWIKHPELRPNRLKRRNESGQGTAESRRQKTDQNSDTSQILFYTTVSSSEMLALNSTAWIVDSAASAHFCHTRSYFTNFQSIQSNSQAWGQQNRFRYRSRQHRRSPQISQ